jgi:hypothetical protein
VDASGKMHMFKHIVANVDLWKQKSGSKSPSDIAKVIGAGPLSVGKLGTVSAPDDSDADMSSPPPGGGGSGGISKTSVGALQSGPHSNVLSPAAHMDKVIGQIDTSQLPVSRYELRNDLVEYDAVPGDWSKVEDIIPAQLSSSGQIVYAENPDGRIWWRRLGLKAPPPSPAAGTGWTTVKNVFSGGEGVLYAVNSDGQLVWYRNATVLAGYDQAASWQQHPVGVGWGEFTRIFSPGKGIIYAVKPDGSLWWYKHYGYLAGSPSTQVGSWSAAKQVGTGWGGFTKVFAAPLGYIYAINGNGELLVYHHLGWENGEVKWEGPIKLADGWDKYRIVFPAMGGTEADGSAPLIVK